MTAPATPGPAGSTTSCSLTRFLIEEQRAGRVGPDLRLLAGGYSNREIARAMFLAEGTVKNYVSAILDKLDTRDRTRAVLKAITLRVI